MKPPRLREWTTDLGRALAALLLLLRWVLLPFGLRLLGRPMAPARVGQGLRRGLERLGMTYIKLGQYLALRGDVVPAPIAQELSALFERVPPMGAGEVRSILERELGRPLPELFASFTDEPIGSASIGQVHRATARDGQALAIKVKRSGVGARFASDIRNLRRMARALDAVDPFGMPVGEIVEQFAQFTGRELDFGEEAITAAALRRSAPPQVYIPFIRPDLSTVEVLTMELIEGVSFDHICRLQESGRPLTPVASPAVLRRALVHAVQASLHFCFATGRFHGDPHPGNLLLRPDGTVAFIDFGIFGELDREQKDDLRRYLWGIAVGRFDEAARVHDRLVAPTERTNLADFHRDVIAMLRLWRESASGGVTQEAQRLAVGAIYGGLLEAMRRNHVRTRPAQLLVWRTLALLDLTAARWPVRVDVAGAIAAFFRRDAARQSRPLFRLEDPARSPGRADDVRRLIEVLPPLGSPQARRRSPCEVSERAADGHERLIAAALATVTGALLLLAAPSAGPAGALLGGVVLTISAAVVVRRLRARMTSGGPAGRPSATRRRSPTAPRS